MLKNNIEEMWYDINKYSNLSKESLFTECVNQKLKWTLSKYIDTLNMDEKELREKSSIRVLKAMRRMQHEEDKEEILKATRKKEQ